VKAIVDRLSAALLVAGLTGLGFCIAVVLGVIASNDLLRTGEAFGPLGAGMLGFPVGILLFGIPFCAVVCLTRAKYRPWRAVPRLLAGFQDYRGRGMLPALGLWVVLATAGTYAAACTIRKIARAT
jgi:hypothetical protein